jgi:transposase
MRLGAAERDERNRKIVEMRRQGQTLDFIGQQVGLTRESVRQIVNRLEGSAASSARNQRKRASAAMEARQRRNIRVYIETNPGCSLEDLSEALEVDLDVVSSLIPDDLRRFVLTDRRTRRSPQTREVAVQAIREAAVFEWPLSTVYYDELIRLGEVSGPSSVRITQLFGTWSKACEKAGVEAMPAVRDNYQSKWTDRDLLIFVADYLRNSKSSGTYTHFEQWATRQTDAPSGQTLRNRLGGWNEIKKQALTMVREEEGPLAILGPEAKRLDSKLALTMSQEVRSPIWWSARSIIAQGPLAGGDPGSTCLALGYVQSGKTTSITALLASAADLGYRLVIALLGSTNLLLDQNRHRVEDALGIGDRHDYVWVSEPNPSGSAGAKRILTHLDRDRIILVPVLKHAGRLRALAEALEGLEHVPTVIVDDEADQASLNTAGQVAESRTYQAIKSLRAAVPCHLYVQYTATPYAPLLLEAEDLLHPNSVEFLQPGPGYVGGREFFIDHSDRVVRDVPVLEEQATKTPPLELPRSLQRALASFCAGAVHLLASETGNPPISMLVHSTARNDVQERYQFLLGRLLTAWRQSLNEKMTEVPSLIQEERIRLEDGGIAGISDEAFLTGLKRVLQEAHLWLVNSTSALDRIDWTVSPVHILVGGNKLDRGFTVEGLTVTYMNRPASVQVDTLEQRARAFGYRGSELPYCQFFASKRTIRSLRNIVFTEYDLRARLQDHIDAGGSVHSWAVEVGLLLPDGMKPTREAVVRALSEASAGWHSVRKPSLETAAIMENRRLVEESGLLTCEPVSYGRLSFRTLELPLEDVIKQLVEPWVTESYSPTWRRDEILDQLRRQVGQYPTAKILLMEDHGKPRTRRWDPETGFVNLFQGRDLDAASALNPYPGDRHTPDLEALPDQVALQIHRVVRRGYESAGELLTLAIYLGSQKVVRKLDV